MSVEMASERVRKLVKTEQERVGDRDAAIRAVARRASVGFWTLANLWRGRAKTISHDLFERLESAYLDLCEQQITELQLEILTIREANPNVAFDDLEDAAADLAARLADARGADAAVRLRDGLRRRLADHSHRSVLNPNSAVARGAPSSRDPFITAAE